MYPSVLINQSQDHAIRVRAPEPRLPVIRSRLAGKNPFGSGVDPTMENVNTALLECVLPLRRKARRTAGGSSVPLLCTLEETDCSSSG